MDRDEFATLLDAAARWARDYARGFVLESLPDAMTFRLLFNQSNDDIEPLRGCELVFPEDDGRQRSCRGPTAIDELWRDGRVPEWIDLCVSAVERRSTVIEALCCGRFTDDDRLLYHRAEGRPPFHVTSPVLPPGYNGERFTLRWMDRRRRWRLGRILRR